VSGLLAALWLLGLFVGAPVLRTSPQYAFVDRLRDALILGVAIPFALGLVHGLYPIACWAVLVICIALAYRRRFVAKNSAPRGETVGQPYVLIGALVAVAWPQLMRPLLDGDSLSYHLPNAASWVQAHSLWTAATRYWWYPPASELFASALYAVGGPFALPWAGFGALALLGFRIHAWARQAFAATPLLADALAAATVTAYPLAIQGGTLQNDVWLAAFWLETLWLTSLPGATATAMRTIAVTALIKPQGWLLAAIGLFALKAKPRLWLAWAGALVLWILRNAVLWRGAIVSPSSTIYGNIAGSTILGHGALALALLARVAFHASPFALLAFCAALLGPLIARREPRLGWAAFAAAALVFVLPFGYNTSVAQLATGASLRLAAPAIAAGALLFARPALRNAALSSGLLLASTLFGVWLIMTIFWNDGSTRVAIPIAALAIAIVATAHLRRTAWPNALALGVAVIATTHLAARHALDYYTDALRVGQSAPGLYRWIEATRPAAIGGWGLRLGVVNVLSPKTRTLDLLDTAACAQARRNGVLLVAVAENDRAPGSNTQRLGSARACGQILYDDPIAVVIKPSAGR
jgi:hypothetical protein